jgi:hypothetical protein
MSKQILAMNVWPCIFNCNDITHMQYNFDKEIELQPSNNKKPSLICHHLIQLILKHLCNFEGIQNIHWSKIIYFTLWKHLLFSQK